MNEDIIKVIQENSLVVRCIPYEVENLTSYREGDEDRIKTIKPDTIRTIFFSESWQRKMIREVRTVKNGGWWYVKEVKNASSTVCFNRKHDKFFAPTLKEAIRLYLNSKK